MMDMNSFTGFDGNMGGGGMGFDMFGMGLMGNQMGQTNQMGQNNQMNNNMMGNQMMGNQMMGNQMMNNQMMGNQMMGNQMMNNQMMGNQMMNNQMMGNQMQQQQQHFSDNKISEMDLKKKLGDMMNDRRSINVQKGTFNPMVSPHMQQNQQMMSGFNNQNFQKGGMVGVSDNQISSAKSSVAASYGIDLKKIQSMSSSEIDRVINKMKNNVMLGAEEIANKGSENIEKSDKKKLLGLLKKAKELHKTKNESSDEEEAVQKPKNQVKKNVKFVDKELADEKPVSKSKKSKLISINAEEYTEPEYFNDYMVDLPENLKNIIGIEVLDYSFPKELCFITNNNNKLVIIIDNEEKVIELEDGQYSIDEITEGLQAAFDNEDMKINIDIDDNEHIVLSSLENEFGFKNDSLGKVLGFTEEEYSREKVYISENKHSLVSKIYLYIDNISNNEPFGMIDLKSRKVTPLSKKFIKPISEIKEMILKFKRRPTKEDDLINFYNKPHKMTFKFESNST
jgi:hypothetical protein